MEGSNNPLKKLRSTLEAAQRNTESMLHKIQKFDQRLASIDAEMDDVQRETATYTKAKENIGLTLSEVEKTFEYFRVAESVRGVIHAGIQLQNPVKQKEFMDAFGRLSEAKRFFTQHRKEIKASAEQLENIEALLKTASASCVEEFNKLLLSCGKCVVLEGDQYVAVNPLTPAVAKDVKLICDILEENHLTTHYAAYEKARIAIINEELLNNRHAHSEEWAAINSDIPYQLGNNPFNSLYLLSLETIRGELQLWGSSFPSSVDSLHVLANIADAVVSQLVQSVQPVLQACNSKQHQDVIVQGNALLVSLEILGIYNSKFEDFRDLCKPDLRHETVASNKLRTLQEELVQGIATSIGTLLKVSEEGANASSSSSSTSRAVAPKRKSILLGGEGSSPAEGASTSNPKAGGKRIVADSVCDLHPNTGNIINCCKELAGLGQAFRQFHAIMTEKKYRIPPGSGSLLQLTYSLLQNLLVSLQSRAESLTPPAKCKATRSLNLGLSNLFTTGDKEAGESLLWAQKHLFLINNLFSIDVFLQNRQALSREAEMRNRTQTGRGQDGSTNDPNNKLLNDLCSNVSTMLASERRAFCEAVATTLSFSQQDIADFDGLMRKGDKSGKGRLLKAKFSLFNSGVESLEAMKGEWRITTQSLRDDLSAQLVNTIVPPYSEFYKQHSGTQFSKKHMSQYLRFPPPTVERILKGFAG